MKPGGSMTTIRKFKAAKGIGYKELFPYFKGEQSLEEASETLKRNTRRFAKRQLTWFRNRMEVNFTPFLPHFKEQVLADVKEFYRMIETEKKQERILLVGVELQGMDNFDMSMEELASLAKTAGGDVRGSIHKSGEKYDTKTFVGSGKLEEIAQMVEADEITTVVVNNRLTPRQNVNLEEILGVKVIDRMQLILDIFAMRARSHEGKLQVHLAQLKYLLPRLVGQGIMLSRQAGELVLVDQGKVS